MDIITVQHAQVVIIVSIVKWVAEPAEYASRVSKYQVKKIPQQSSHCRLTLRRKRILLNAERLQRKEPGAAEVQDQMDTAGSMEDKVISNS